MPDDWLNDGVKGFLPGTHDVPGLRVWAPEPIYLLAMSARVDTKDADDLKTLIHILQIKDEQSIFSIVEKYYPRHEIPIKVKFFQ